MLNMSSTIGENIKYCMYKYNIAMSDLYNSISYINEKYMFMLIEIEILI